jgi:hypothetical protein
MLLNRKAAADLGGNLQMDLSYATIPTPDGNTFKLNREVFRRYHIEDPRSPKNELKYVGMILVIMPFCLILLCL